MAKKSGSRATAESMAQKQREISVSEFFAKNRHLLGFDNPRKALLTTIKEAVDNSLDACEEAGILPEITVTIEHLTEVNDTRYRVTILDNGPGVVRKQVEHIFGRLLYGSKFHRLKMSRGQQGIGISAAGMYGLMTTGKPMVIVSKTGPRKAAHRIVLAMDTTRNRPEVTEDAETDAFPVTSTKTGTSVTIELDARYVKGKASVDAYLEQTAIANPHAKITFVPPGKHADADANIEDGQATLEAEASEASSGKTQTDADLKQTTVIDGTIIFPRTVEELPPETSEIKPHPHGVELGTFLRMLKQTDQQQLGGFLKNEFCRVPPAAIKQVTGAAGVTGNSWLKSVDHGSAEKLYAALQAAKLRNPPTDCLSPIGVRQMLAGLLKGVRAEFYTAATRAPAVYRGMPFQIEAAIAFGGGLPGDESSRVIRFANRVPLLYQQSACSAFKSVAETAWRGYGLQQPRGALRVGPMVVMIHMASVWVPFTSESKEAIADYDEIRKEMKLALQECGRKLGMYLRRRQKMKRESEKRDVFSRYIAEIARSAAALTGEDEHAILEALQKQAEARTAIADAELDEDGNYVKPKRERSLGDDVVIVQGDDAPPPPAEPASVEAKPTRKKRGVKKSSKKAGSELFQKA